MRITGAMPSVSSLPDYCGRQMSVATPTVASLSREGDRNMRLEARIPRTLNCADADERRRIHDLLDFLPVLYPGGDTWLERRLDDVAENRAYAYAMEAEDAVAAVCIGIHKPSRRFKISTLFVAPEHRGKGFGRALLKAMITQAVTVGAEEAYITGATSVRHELGALLHSAGFAHVHTEPCRYGPDRDEDVYRLDLTV